MNRALTPIALGAALALISTVSSASGDPARGKEKAAPCAACHGADGNGNSAVEPQPPRLAGQYNLYLQQVLHEYKEGARSKNIGRENAIMKGQVANLSEQDIADIAAYFASLPGKLETLEGHVGGTK